MAYIWDKALSLSKSGPGQWILPDLAENFYNVNKSAHGGYVIGLVAQAISLELLTAAPKHSLPVSLSTAFVGAVYQGMPVEIVVEVIKSGKRYTFVHAQLKQQGKVCLDANGVYGEPSASRASGDYRTSAYSPSSIRKPEDCVEYDKLMVDIGVYPPQAGRSDFRVRKVDPTVVGTAFKTVGPKMEALGKNSSATDVPQSVMDAKLEAWCGFADGRPMDVSSLVYFTDYLPPLNLSLSLRGKLPSKNFFWDWTTISYSINFLNPIPAVGQIIVRSECEIVQDTDERRCLVQNYAIDETGKVICVARQAALATAFPLRGTDAKM